MTAQQADLFLRDNENAGGRSANRSVDVQGLVYEREFLSADQEREIVREIDSSVWRNDLKRRVQHYGWRYDYKSRRVLPSMYLGPLPAWLDELARAIVLRGWFEKVPDQAIVNEYYPGQGIALHVDCVPCFGDSVASVSLLSNVVMNFHNPETAEVADRVLEARSILVLTEDSRRIWRHGIASRLTDPIDGAVVGRKRRISVTFRTVNSESRY